MNEGSSNQLLFDDQSYIKRKINALYAFMFTVSSGTNIHPLISCILVFLEDIQILYFTVYDKSVINLYEGIRKLITYFAFDNVSYTIFYYSKLVLQLIIIALSLVIAIHVLAIHPENYRENLFIKFSRVGIIALFTVFFPVSCHIFAKCLIPKDGKLYYYPDVSYVGDQFLYFVLSVVSFILFLFLQLFVFPFIFVNPTPFKKFNSLCQSYSFSSFKYNCIIIIFSFAALLLKAYLERFSSYVFILMFIVMLFLLSEVLKSQPFYNKYLNMVRSGAWLMTVVACIVDLFSYLFGHDKSFFGILLMVFSVISFFVGFFLCKYRFKKHIEGIYKRFKQKKIDDRIRYKRENGIQSSYGSLNNKSKEGDEEDSEENLISIESYSSDEDNKNDNKKSDKRGSDSEEDSEESEDDTENESVGSVQLSDRVSEKISTFGEIRDILENKVLNEPVVIYNTFNEFELACRFISTNETNEAFQLMRELYAESIKQYTKNPYIFTYYAYYLLYIDGRKLKEEKDILIKEKKPTDEEESYDESGGPGSDFDSSYDDNSSSGGDSPDKEKEQEQEQEKENEVEQKSGNDDDQNNNNDNYEEIRTENEIIFYDNQSPDTLLTKALSGKLNYLGKYFVKYLLFEIREKKKEDKDYYKKEALEVLINLQHDAVEKHITILNLLKKFFSNIKYMNNNNNESEKFDIDKYLELIYQLKKKTLNLYQDIIAKYPDEKSTYQLYTLFMSEIINQNEVDKYALNEGDSFMALNAPDKNDQNKNEKKSKSRYAGSVSSFGLSVGGSAYGDSETKKRKILKKNMIHSFTDRSRKISKFIIGMFIMIFILFIISAFYGFIHISNFNSEIKSIQVLEDMDFSVLRLMRYARLHNFSLLLRTELYYDFNIQKMDYVLDIIEDNYLPILKKYSLKPASEHPVIVYSTDSITGKTESELVHLNGYELMRKIVVWGRGITRTSVDEWLQKLENGENILLDYRFRTLEDNFQEYFSSVFQETIDIIYNDEISSQNSQIYIIYALTGVLIVLSLAVNFLGITPLYNNTKTIDKKTLRMFKYLLKGSINDIISKFEVGIESITETYDISFDSKKNKAGSVDSQNAFLRNINKLKGFIINILLLGSVMLLAVPIIVNDQNIISNLNYNLAVGDRKSTILNINVYQYETLLHDVRSFLPGVAESYLNKEIKKLEDIQTNIYRGYLGLQSTTKMRYLDSLLINQECRLDSDVCESLVEEVSIDVTKSVVKLGLNELIEEFVDKAKSTLYNSHIHEYKTEEHIYGSIVEADQKYLLACFADGDFLFQFNIIDHLIAGLLKFDSILYDNLFETVKSTMLYLVFIIIGGVVLIIISFIISLRTIRKTSESLNELVNTIFVIPTSTINMIPQFKRFIETGSFDEE